MAFKNKDALEKVLPAMARDMGIMKKGIMQLVSSQSGSSRSKAEQFFANQQAKEAAYEAKLKTPTRTSTSGGSSRSKGLGFGTGTSVLDFIKNIANVLMKTALVSLGTMGLAKILESSEIRDNIKSFVKNLFMGILNVITTGANMLTSVMKENWPEIKEAIVQTLVAIKNLLVTSIEHIGDLLSDKRVWDGIVEIVQTIFTAIKKILSTEVEIAGQKVSLGVVLGTIVTAFYALQGATWLLKRAAEAAAASLFSLGGGKGGKGVPMPGELPGGQQGKTPGPTDKIERTRAGKEALDKIEQERIAQEAKDLSKARLAAAGTVGAVVVGGSYLSNAAAENIQKQNMGGLEYLSGGMDDTALAAHIEMQSRQSTTPTTKPAASTAPSKAFKEQLVAGAKKGSASSAFSKTAPDDFDMSLLNAIASGESGGSGYNAMNQGGTKDTGIIGSGNSEQIIGKKLTDMTIGEILSRGKKPLGDEDRIFAAGRYQIIPGTLQELVNAGVVATGDKFDSATQDKLGKALLEKRGLAAYKAGQIPASQFQNQLSSEWAAIANTSGGTSLGGPNKANLNASQKIATLLNGGKISEAPTQVASAASSVTEKPTEENPFEKMLSTFENVTGGVLGINSKELAAALFESQKALTSGGSVIDNSTTVMPTTPLQVGSSTASTYDNQLILSAIIDRKVWTGLA